MSPRSKDFLVQAKERLKVATVDLEAGFPTEAVSNAYFAMLYAARAALSERDLYSKTHRGVWSQFAEQFVKTKAVEAQWSAVAETARDIREGGDYDAVSIDASTAEGLITQASKFVDLIEQLIE